VKLWPRAQVSQVLVKPLGIVLTANNNLALAA